MAALNLQFDAKHTTEIIGRRKRIADLSFEDRPRAARVN
jgi:hypothetical protein